MYEFIHTKYFEEALKNLKKDKNLMNILFKKIINLKKNPKGKFLVKSLKGYKSTRVAGKYRLIFKVNEKKKSIYLVMFAHRKAVYGNMVALIE